MSSEPTGAIIPAEREAPPPMAPLTSERIHPDNISHEQAVMRAMGLDNKQWRDLLRKRNQLANTLKRAGYKKLMDEYKAMGVALQGFTQQYYQLKQQRPAGWQERVLSLRDVNNRTKAARLKLYAKLKPLVDKARTLQKMDEILAVFEEARKRKKEQAHQYEEIKKETLIWHTIIRAVWAGAKECHHVRHREGRVIYDLPEIETVWITPNVLYFKILTLQKTLTGWKSMLPYDVFVEDLLSDRIVNQISDVSGRQVKAISPRLKPEAYGSWYALYRTDTPNGVLDRVDYEEVMRWYPEDMKSRVVLAVGVGEQNKIQWVNLNDFPHWLIGGSTGTGKSNLMNVLFSTLISFYTPQELRILSIDLKGGLELGAYKDTPHIIGAPVEELEDCAEALAQMEAEMQRRFGLLKAVGAKDLYSYNRICTDNPLPRIVIVIDEFARTVDAGDLTKRIHSSLMQLTSMSRAAGINIIVCTQDPRVDTLPGKIKSNLVVRIAMHTTSFSASKIIIDTGHAAKIAAIKGRAVLSIDGLPKEVQTPYISEDSIKAAIAIASGMGNAMPLNLPAPAASNEQRWTPEKIIELVIQHIGGHVSADKIYVHLKDSGITNPQIRKLVETIYKMENISFEGREYRIKRIKNQRYLIAVDEREEVNV